MRATQPHRTVQSHGQYGEWPVCLLLSVFPTSSPALSLSTPVFVVFFIIVKPLNSIIRALIIVHSAEGNRSKAEQRECALAVKRFCQNPLQLFLVAWPLIECKPRTISLSASACRWPHVFVSVSAHTVYLCFGRISETWLMPCCVCYHVI